MEPIKTDAEALYLLDLLQKYISNNPTNDSPEVVRTPLDIVFTCDGIRFQNRALVWDRGVWIINHFEPPAFTQCLLTLCIRTDLRSGDIVWMADEDRDYDDLDDYYIILDSTSAVHWTGEGAVCVIHTQFTYHYRVEIDT